MAVGPVAGALRCRYRGGSWDVHAGILGTQTALCRGGAGGSERRCRRVRTCGARWARTRGPLPPARPQQPPSPHAAMHAAFCSRDVCSPYGVRSVSSMRVFVSLLRRLLHPQLWFFSLGRQGVLSNPSGFVVVQGVVASSAVLFASTAVGARSAEPNLSIFAHGADIPDRAHSPADSTLPLRRYAGQRGRTPRRGGARAHHNPPPWPSARENPVRRRASGPYGPRLTMILDPWAGER